MDFKDLFGQKLQAQQNAAATADDEASRAREDHAQLVEELRPKLKALVQEVFAALEGAGLPPVEVRGRTGLRAYALGFTRLRRRRSTDVEVEVVIDSEGNIALRQLVETYSGPTGPSIVTACYPFSSDEVLSKACRGDEPTGDTRIHLNSKGEIMLTEQYIAGDDYQHRRTPLAEYLADLGVRAVTGKLA